MVVNRPLHDKKRFTIRLNKPFKKVYQVSKTTNDLLGTDDKHRKGTFTDAFLPGEGKLYELD